MKTINFELCKKLSEAGLLDNIETEYFIPKLGYVGNWIYNPYLISQKNEMYKTGKLKSSDEIYKTLTIEEAIEFIGKNMCGIKLLYPNAGVWNLHTICDGPSFKGTLIEVFEYLIEYLLNNNLITK